MPVEGLKKRRAEDRRFLVAELWEHIGIGRCRAALRREDIGMGRCRAANLRQHFGMGRCRAANCGNTSA